jgi:DNA segregation ATPase FtsK/SpoIIIE-like protein
MSKERLRHQLEVQSLQIEQVFARRRVPAQVSGGTIRPNSIRFDLHGQLAAGWERLLELKEELATALRARDVNIQIENGRLSIEVWPRESYPVDLLDLQAGVDDLTPLTAVLGLSEDERPVLLNFQSPELAHLLIVGGREAGKTALLRTLALSLAMANKQSQVQLLVISGDETCSTETYLLRPINYLPHILAPVIDRPEEVRDAFRFLVEEMEYRLSQGVDSPLIFVLIDRVVSLLQQGGQDLLDPLTRLAQRGAAAGLRLVLTTRNPNAAVLDNFLRTQFPVRIVGRVRDEQAAYAASGVPGSQAELLQGQGDFVAVVNESTVVFQGAYVGDYDFHMSVDKLHRRRQAALLARPASTRPHYRTESAPRPSERTFVLDIDGRPTILGEAEDDSRDA